MTTPQERARYAELKALKVWSPEFIELAEKLRREATWKWVKQDVFGDENTGDRR